MSNTPEADRLRKMVDSWKEIQDRLPPSVSVQGGALQTESLIEAIDRSADIVEESEAGNVDQVLKLVHWPNIVSQVNSLQNSLDTVINNGLSHQIFQQRAQELVNAIWSLRSALVWVLPYPSTDGVDTSNIRFGEIVASAERVLALREQAGDAERDLRGKLQLLGQQFESAKNLVTEIEGFERTAANARTNAEASSSATKQTADSVEALLNKQTESSKVIEDLLVEFQRKKIEVDETLEGASKVALAKAFQDRRKSLSAERWGWVGGFASGIVLLVIAGVLIVPRVMAGSALEGQAKYWEVVGHFLILGPIVWATWFAARKAGQTMRLAEDYAFKEAAAHSFVGYKREMAGDIEMLSELRQYAVKNFGADPLRVLSDDEAASPLHDVMNKLLQRIDKLKPEEAMKALGDLVKALGQATGAK